MCVGHDVIWTRNSRSDALLLCHEVTERDWRIISLGCLYGVGISKVLFSLSILDVARKTQEKARSEIPGPPQFPTLLIQPPLVQNLLCEVTQNNCCSGSQDAVQSLHGHFLKVEHALLSSSVYHGVLPTDLISCDGDILCQLCRVGNYIQERRRRLDHDCVSTLCEVAEDGTASETTATDGELVAFAVAEGGGGASRYGRIVC